MAPILSMRAKALAEKTEGAYSFDRYKDWTSVAKALLQKYTFEQSEAILLSKWTRWAADMGGKPYGKAIAKDVIEFAAKQGLDEVKKLTEETFG